ncbi:MAG: ABC transporter permease [Formosimonas sp.]
MRFNRIVVLRLLSYFVVGFIYLPLLTIALYAFTVDDITFAFPLTGLTTKWFGVALSRPDVGAALWLSVKVALIATSCALVLGTLAALALSRLQWRFKDSASVLFILPIALPGILTGLALLTTFRSLGWSLGTWTIVIGHTTFCIVVVYNNVVARLRRMPWSMVEASMDLGANPWQTFVHVMLPNMRSALLAAALLAFALSFDELIVTLFTAGADKTLPIWMFNELFRPRERPVTNVVATVVMILTLIPVYVAYRLGEQDRD